MKQIYTSGLELSRTVSGQRTAMGRRLLMMLFLLAFVGGVNVSVTLPYAESFEDGIGEWTLVDCNDGTEVGTGGGGHESANSFMFKYNTNPPQYLISPEFDGAAVPMAVSFWYKIRSSGYPETFQVGYSTTTNDVNTAFTWEAEVETTNPNDWLQYETEFPAGTKYVAIRYNSNDQYYLYVDDFSFEASDGFAKPTNLVASEITKNSVTLSWTENGDATAWEICLNGDEENLIAAESNPFTLTGLTPETEYTAKVRAIKGEKKSKWSNDVTFTTEIRFHAPADLVASNVTATTAEISWTADADATGAVLEYASTEGASLSFTEYKYDNGTLAGTIGTGDGAFQWGVMFPAGSYTGNTLSKVSVYDPTAMTGSLTIYNDGATAPANAVVTVPVTFTGVGDFIDIEVNATIDDTKNVWVIINNESGADYPAAGSTDDLNNANGRWVEISGAWYDLANAGVSNRAFMIHAEIGTVDLSSLTWTTVENATSPYELTDLTPETKYAVRAKSVFEEGESKWTSTFFTTLTDNPVPANIVADLAADGATLTWEGEGESYNFQYRTAASTTPIFEDDFANGLDQWTLVTAGEGSGWIVSEYGATSYSWTNSDGSLNADNWLISPAVELGGILKFTTLTANSYPDSYEVLLSTTGNETTDFTVTLQPMKVAGNEVVTIDLSAYAGQNGYIAIHHVSNDCYLLAIQGFGVYNYVPESDWQDMAVTEKTATISGLATNNLYEYQIQSVKGEKVSAWSAMKDFALITLDSDADNTSVINKYDGKFAHVTLSGRTFYKDNSWNTLYLPFNLTLDEVVASPLGDADIRTLTSNITDEEDKVTLNFTAEGEALTTWGGNMFYGGVPYIAKWTEGSDIVNPEFANVTITSARYYVGDNTKVAFEGTYAPKSFETEDKSILVFGEGNKTISPLAGDKIDAFSGYFELIGTFAEYNASGVKQFITNLGGGETTGIVNLTTGSQDNGNWYDINGRKYDKQPMSKGLYIHNGKKQVVK